MWFCEVKLHSVSFGIVASFGRYKLTNVVRFLAWAQAKGNFWSFGGGVRARVRACKVRAVVGILKIVSGLVSLRYTGRSISMCLMIFK